MDKIINLPDGYNGHTVPYFKLWRYHPITGYWNLVNGGSLEFCQALALHCWGEGLHAISAKYPKHPVSQIDYSAKQSVVDAVKKYGSA